MRTATDKNKDHFTSLQWVVALMITLHFAAPYLG